MSHPGANTGGHTAYDAEPGQLALLQMGAPPWRLDRRTCEIGRLGVAAAREALERARGADQSSRRPATAA
ncbi:MAG TPA: hypothetical protein VGV93_13415 [Acidimicrobiales bacterium]|nr:hypothetical protein [Acidimicrobiales bacterium]